MNTIPLEYENPGITLADFFRALWSFLSALGVIASVLCIFLYTTGFFACLTNAGEPHIKKQKSSHTRTAK